MTYGVLQTIPFWLICLTIIFVLLISLELGFKIGLSQREYWKDADTGGGKVVLSSLLLLLGLILAFTYSAGLKRHDMRKQAVNMEANAIGTAYLRADFVNEPERSTLKKQLFEYARKRTGKYGKEYTTEELQTVYQQSYNLHEEIWATVKQIVQNNDHFGPYESSLVSAINDVIDAHTIRFSAISDKMPFSVTLMQLFVAAASLMVAGFNAGVSGRMSRWRMFALSFALIWVMIVIQDYDRPLYGFIHVNHDGIKNLILDMELDLAE